MHCLPPMSSAHLARRRARCLGRLLAGLWLGLVFGPAAARAAWTIRVEAGRHGSARPGTEFTVPDGGEARVTFHPDPGYQVAGVTLNGDAVEAAEDHHFAEVRADQHLVVRFEPSRVRSLPFRENFAGHGPGPYHLNTHWWYGDPMDLSVEIVQTNRQELVGPRVRTDAAPGAVTDAMRIFGSSVTHYFEDPESERVWIDLRLRTDLVRHTNVNVEADTQMAFLVNGDGHVVLYHRDLAGNRPVWTILTQTRVEEEEWIRLTLLTDYQSVADGGPFFQLYVNGALVSHPLGRREPKVTAPADGSWFATITPGRRALKSVTLTGTGYLDEVAVDRQHEGFPARVHPIKAAVAPGGGGEIDHAGEYRVPEGWMKTYRLHPWPGYAVLDLRVDGQSVGARDAYTFPDVRKGHAIEALFAPRIEVSREGNGTVTPGGTVVRPLGEDLMLVLQADEGHHIAAVRVRRGLEAQAEPVDDAFGQGVTRFEYAWGAIEVPGGLQADFAPDQHTLRVVSEWGGTLLNGEAVAPGAVLDLPWGHPMRLTIELSPIELGETRFVCTGWTGEGSVPAAGAAIDTGPLVVKGDSLIEWQWRTEHRLQTAAVGPRAAAPTAKPPLDPQGQAWLAADTQIELRIGGAAARPDGFRRWHGDIPAGQANAYPLTVTMDQPRQIEAVFE